MKRPPIGSRIGIAVIAGVSLLTAAIAGLVALHVVAADRRNVSNADFANHVRTELARIHTGKVDAATLARIERAQSESASGISAQEAEYRMDDETRSSIVRYLGDSEHERSGGFTTASFVTVADADTNPPRTTDAQPASSAPDNRTYVGQKVCESCHQQEASNWAHTIHAAVFTLNPRTPQEAQGCEACHGPGSEHIKHPSDLSTIISFSSKSKTPVPVQNAQCLGCHAGGQRIFWHASVHETNNLACSDCHNPMSKFAAHGLTARESINQTCFACHKVQRAEFSERSHMPLLEGKIDCTDCHNPHGSTTAPLLKADSVNEVCYGCHADKRGPFLFEHPPVRENCLNCHTPHGSNFEALLTAPRPMLCQQCHAQDGHPAQLMTAGNLPRGIAPDPRLISTSCQTCHVNIHGSNDPSGSRFER